MSKSDEKAREVRGHVTNGVVVLDQPAALPEGAEVRVRAVSTRQPKKAAHRRPKSLYERLRRVIGKAKGLPSDAARNHDHWLSLPPVHGTNRM
jgi:hypothetical protein